MCSSIERLQRQSAESLIDMGILLGNALFITRYMAAYPPSPSQVRCLSVFAVRVPILATLNSNYLGRATFSFLAYPPTARTRSATLKTLWWSVLVPSSLDSGLIKTNTEHERDTKSWGHRSQISIYFRIFRLVLIFLRVFLFRSLPCFSTTCLAPCLCNMGIRMRYMCDGYPYRY